ncbi:MAG: helix-turn-helix transcriptional regulator [Rhodospirillales bacterium]
MRDASVDQHEWAIRPHTIKSDTLTPRETECLQRLAQGYRSEAIAYELGVKRVTVDLHISNAKRKLSAMTREHAVALALHYELIKPEFGIL